MSSGFRAALTAGFVFLFALGVTTTALTTLFWAFAILTFHNQAVAIVIAGAGALGGVALAAFIGRSAWRFEHSAEAGQMREGRAPDALGPLPHGGTAG